MKAVVAAGPEGMSRKVLRLIRRDARLRSQIISIGIPILMPDGRSLLRTGEIKIPPYRGEAELPATARNIERWSHDGWVDLRVSNMKRWQKRMREVVRMVEGLPEEENSSRTFDNRDYWRDLREIDPGKLCGWIFTYEEKGRRMKA